MPPSRDVLPTEPPASRIGASSLKLPKIRGSPITQQMDSSLSSLPSRTASASVSSLFASTSGLPGSRPVSPSGDGTPRLVSESVFVGTPGESQNLLPSDRKDDPRNLILQAFVPHIAVHTSDDTHELVQEKGFLGGLWELLRPFGERIQGKVTVRDSIGAGKTWEDFAVRFVQLGDGIQVGESIVPRRSAEGAAPTSSGKTIPDSVLAQRVRTGGDVMTVETLVDRHLTHAEDYPNMDGTEDYLSIKSQRSDLDTTSPFYTLFLRRLLSGIPLTPHETFSHPVACVIAISSRNTNPIETLRNLYDESSRGEKRLPLWVSNEYLRYYVLVHDEERDDIANSIALFEKMKRHFGLHCHLLRLRSTRCVATDDDSIRLPQCEWLSAAEELAIIRSQELEEEVDNSFLCIFDSDATAIRTFIREMVTQSVVPSMERCISIWNEQVASRRRGLSGRLLKISKWTGFGGASRTASPNNNGPNGSNYDALQGFYRPDAPEAIMRKLADYALMLRDWKMAQSTYELLRSDFNNDKAWKYHAATNEMAAISTLMLPQTLSSKTRSETIEQMLSESSYSYITRCGLTYGALRCLAFGMELLRLRGGSATDEAAKWGIRILDYRIVGAVGDALIKERVSACYASKKGAGSGHWGDRTRKSAVWSIQAADSWLTLGKSHQSKQRVKEAKSRYSSLTHPESILQFSAAGAFLDALEQEIHLTLYPPSAVDAPGTAVDLMDNTIIEESEAFDSRPHRRSLMGGIAPPLAGLETAPLQTTLLENNDEENKLGQFE